MVDKVELWECGICGYRYKTEAEAKQCEDRGPGKEYPIGCIYGDHTPGAMYEKITFAVAYNQVEPKGMYAHMNTGGSWACRDNGAGDSLGNSRCGGPTLFLNHHQCRIDPSSAHFIRMVNYLRKNQIEITVWDGEKAVSYATFLKRFKNGDWG